MHYVYSTATCPTAYVKYKEPSPTEKFEKGASKGHSQIVKKVIIKGGHGVNTKHLFTPNGVVTQVSDDDMEFLLQDQNFQRHVSAGFITYDKKKVDPEKKAANMQDKDGSAPLTPKDFEKVENDDGHRRIFKGVNQLLPA